MVTRLQSRAQQPYHRMLVQLESPNRQIEIRDRTPKDLRELNLVMGRIWSYRGDELVTEDEILADGDQVEIRPVISGG